MHKSLIVSNEYPSKEDIYKNGFVHRRAKSYQKFNIEIEVFCLNNQYNETEVYIYDEIKVTKGNIDAYSNFLKENHFDSFLIHFVNKNKLNPILSFKKNPKVLIWIHGFEAENWHRRWFDFLTSKQKLKNVLYLTSNFYPDRLNYLNKIYLQQEFNITFIYVSKWFKENVADVDANASPEKYEIIPNVIDGELFNYVEKDAMQRKKILSIRPYASMKYANDLTVNSILELSKKDFFKDLEITIYGDGEYFEDTIKPLRKFDNIDIHKKFLTQKEISELHKEHGVFLCPTRWDSQGVSMCEAMSSGLVPVSTDITAIPEFVSHLETGLLAKPESSTSLAMQIEKLYFDKDLFNELSFNASKKIRKIADEDVVIRKELELILHD